MPVCTVDIPTKFSRLTIIAQPVYRDERTTVEVVCDCGVKKEVDFYYLKKGRIRSCGCLRKELSAERMKNKSIHGFTNFPLFQVWKAMLSRCYNPSDISYKRYGAKGVVVCDEWRTDFMKFNNWCLLNGWEKGKQIDKDKIGTGKLYSPESCVIISRQENCWLRKTSRMVFHNGETKSLAEWCHILGLKYDTVRARIQKGILPEVAFKKVA